ncbi:MAG: epoxyqueuosine reductase QueH [Tannerellaceae bacterium]|jgi:predicted adenine nucleotide alpha hydrolase (AANH) superfamily ATPase|nr:epoxyqueuosine reductase QueH [Tannerellaceae bacterium]
MQTLALHTCCAPCSAAVIEWLMANGIRPLLFYYNPNIFPEQEYQIRRQECSRYAHSLGLEAVDGDASHDLWLERITGLEDEPERGLRCLECFKIRLLATANFAAERGIKSFATTLAASRQKSLEQIAEAGHWAAAQYPGISFYEKNWRKGGLSERRRELLRDNDFYNQQYCGCEFSLRRRTDSGNKV